MQRHVEITMSSIQSNGKRIGLNSERLLNKHALPAQRTEELK